MQCLCFNWKHIWKHFPHAILIFLHIENNMKDLKTLVSLSYFQIYMSIFSYIWASLTYIFCGIIDSINVSLSVSIWKVFMMKIG